MTVDSTASALLSPLQVGALSLRNRVVMAPMTRARAGSTHVPNALLEQYYAQRSSAGLILTEATMIRADGGAFLGEPGLFDNECVQGWRRVTDAVHSLGGLIVVQLWHPGRATHPSLNGGVQPISSTNRAIESRRIRTLEGQQPYPAPRAIELAETSKIAAWFGLATERAVQAGFDGVQIHGAHGYLLDQFLRDGINDRTDSFGGSLSNRARLLMSAVDAAVDIMGAGRVSLRVSPLVPMNDASDSDGAALIRHVAQEAEQRSLSFLDLRHADFGDPREAELADIVKQEFSGALFVGGGYDRVSAIQAITSKRADAVVFGRAYIANPGLVELFAENRPLSAFDPETLYTRGAAGYVTY